MDKIRILNLKILAKHGAYEFEKEKEGLFDLRNAFSVGFAKGVVDCLKDYDYKYGEGERMVHYTYDFNVADRFDKDGVIEFPLV